MAAPQPTRESLERRLAEMEAEVQRLGRELSESSDRQSATSEVLEVISRSPSDLQAALDAIVLKALTLLESDSSQVARIKNGIAERVAYAREGAILSDGTLASPVPSAGDEGPLSPVAQAREGRTSMLHGGPDGIEAVSPKLAKGWKEIGRGSAITVPLITTSGTYGLLGVSRRSPEAYTPSQVILLETFARQAVIAIQNARLFGELEERNREVTEALDRQTATSELLEIVSRTTTDLEPVAEAIAERVLTLCGAGQAGVYVLEGDTLRRAGRVRTDTALDAPLINILSSGTMAGRAIIERRTVRFDGASAEYEAEFPDLARMGQDQGFAKIAPFESRHVAIVPLISGESPVGTIGFSSRDHEFTDSEIALVEIFAGQAVIAIQNARLFNELQESNRDLSESLAEQSGTAEVLKIISSSPADLEAVLKPLAAMAERLAGAERCGIFVDLETHADRIVHQFYVHNRTPDFGLPNGALEQPLPWPDTPMSRARATLAPCQFSGTADELEREFAGMPHVPPSLRTLRTRLAVPLIRDGSCVGTMAFNRDGGAPFTERQIAIAQTFADQAVIAIENARLFNELQDRNKEVTEALARQTATSDVLETISRSPTDLQSVLDAIVRNAVNLMGSQLGLFLRRGESAYEVVAEAGEAVATPPRSLESPHPQIPLRESSATSTAVRERRTVHLWGGPDAIEHDYPVTAGLWRELGATSANLVVPVLSDEGVLGVLVVNKTSPEPYLPAQVDLLETFARQAAIAIENARLFNELQESNREVSEALDQQTAMADVLGIIASSATDAQPVLEAVIRSAARLCDAEEGGILLPEAGLLRPVAAHGELFAGLDFVMANDATTVSGRAFQEQRVIRVDDLAAETGTLYPGIREIQQRFGYHSALVAPLIRDGESVGTISLARNAVRPFSDKHIELLQTFADQAVIAIENARLFNELQERNRDVSEALSREQITAEILRQISRAPEELDVTLAAIGEAVRRALGGQSVNWWFAEANGFVAHRGGVRTGTGYLRDAIGQFESIRPEEDLPWIAQAFAGHHPVIIPDGFALEGDAIPDSIARDAAALGMTVAEWFASINVRSYVVIPVLREDRVLAAFDVSRPVAGAFTEEDIALLEGFADQAAIAIENARLIRELRDSNREVTESLAEQSGTAEVLKIISSSPTDLEAVLKPLAAMAAKLVGADMCGIKVDLEVHADRIVSQRYWYNPAPDLGLPDGVFEDPLSQPDGPWARARATLAPFQFSGTGDEFEREFEGSKLPPSRRTLRTRMVIPLIRDGICAGEMALNREGGDPFTARQIAIAQTFADQAVIAIENARLFNELQESNREVSDALERQTAISEVLSIISRSTTDAQPVLDDVVERAVRLSGATHGFLELLDGPDQTKLASSIGSLTKPIGALTPIDGRAGAVAMAERRPVFFSGTVDEMASVWPGSANVANARYPNAGIVNTVTVPLLRETSAAGFFVLFKAQGEPWDDAVMSLLQTFADQAVIAIENARLFNELQASNREVTEALDRQTAIAEVLEIISQAPTDVGPALEAIGRTAARLCEADSSVTNTVEGDDIIARGNFNWPEASGRLGERRQPDSVVGQAVARKRTIRVEDLAGEPVVGVSERSIRHLLEIGRRAGVVVPMFREDRVVAVFSLWRNEPRPFTDSQVALVETFAAQAAIALQNARLFREITEANETLTASADVLRIVSDFSTSQDDVLNAVVTRAARLVGAERGLIRRVEGNRTVSGGTYNIAGADDARDLDRSFMLDRAIIDRTLLQFTGSLDEFHAAYPASRAADPPEDVLGHSRVAVPIVRDGQAIGGMLLIRDDARPFAGGELAILQSFADQAAIAIQNARLFREIEEKTQQVEEVSRHKSEFLATMSHELRTPLNAIIGYAELLQEVATDAGDDSYLLDLKKIHSAGQHLLTLIGGILDLAKIDAGRMTMYLEDFDVYALVSEVQDVVAPLVRAKGNEFGFECPADVGIMHADVVKVRQVLFNVLSNAAKFTKEGEVTLTVSHTDEGFRFAVRDTGIGMAPDELTRIFESFSQADAETARNYGGTGLGLTLSREFCLMMGGTITVESELGFGSTFTVTLPAVVKEEAGVESVHESQSAPGAGGAE